MTISRAYYHCTRCGASFCPRDKSFGIENASLSSGVLRMVGFVGGAVSFEEGSAMIKALGEIQVSPKTVERGAEVLHVPRAVIMGEAACLVDPLTAEGLRPALASGCLAAKHLLHALAGRPEALADYTTAIQAQWGKEFQWAKRLASVFYQLNLMGHRVDTITPQAHQRMAEMLCGPLRYSALAKRALQKLALW